jgi:energy-coupling factor transport system ATP-binding protein
MISFTNVTYRYVTGQPSLSDFTAAFKDGVRTALFGENGAGKSTVALLANGLLRPNGGTVRVDGLDTTDHEHVQAVRAKVGLVFQNPDSQFVAATVEREIAFGLENMEVPRDDMQRKVGRVLEQFGLEGIRDVSPRDLSEGEKAMVALASIVVMKPSFLVLDEPTAHLGGKESERFWALLDRLEPKPSLILITQKRREVLKCERAVALSSGRKTFDGTGRDLLRAVPVYNGWEELTAQLVGLGVLTHEKPAGIDELIGSVLANRARAKDFAEEMRLIHEDLQDRGSWIESLSLVDAGYVYKRGLPGERVAMANANLRLERGEFLGIIGPNGSGKTTISALLAGLLEPESGCLSVNGKPDRRPHHDPKFRREIGFVFQNPERAFFTESCLSEVAFGPKNFKLSDPQARASWALGLVGLDAQLFGDRSPFEISYGEQRRLALACALAHDPAIVFFDEPTAGLDRDGRALVVQILRKMKLSARTVVLVSHDLGLILDLCDRVVVMNHGRVVRDASPEGVLRESPCIKLGPELENIQKVLRRLKASGLDIGASLPSPRRAAHAILDALRRGETETPE